MRERGESGRGGGCVDGVIDDGVEMVEENWLRKGILRDALAKAHELFARERRVVREETDESGRKWLEGFSGKRKRRRKGWCDAVGDV